MQVTIFRYSSLMKVSCKGQFHEFVKPYSYKEKLKAKRVNLLLT